MSGHLNFSASDYTFQTKVNNKAVTIEELLLLL